MKTSTSSNFLRQLLAPLCAAILPALLATSVSAQTPPTAQTLPYSQNFGTATFTALPAGVGAWNGLNGGNVTNQTTAAASTPTGNATITAASTAQSGGGAYGYATGGNAQLYIQTSSNASNGVSQPVIAINTSGKQNIVLGYEISVISAQPRTIGVLAQYRVGTNGTWASLTASSGSNPFSQAGGTTGLKTTVSATLPTDANNQPVVQVRWANWRGTESGNSSGFGLDNISVTGDASSGPTIASFSPSSGEVGSTVVITGSNFGSGPGVRFNGIAAFSTVNPAGTEITATVPSGATTGPITVEVDGQTSTSATSFTVVDPLAPTLSTTGTLTAFSAIAGTPSASQSFTVSGANLSGNATVTAPGGFQVSSDDSTFGPTAALVPIGGVLNDAPVYVRIAASAPVGPVSGNVSVAATGATTQNVAASGTVVAPPSFVTLSNTNANSYTQNFDTLGTATIAGAISATAGVQTSLGGAVTNALDGWYAAKIAGTGTSATGIVADNGTSNSGAVYNYGSTANSDRSLGALASSSTTPGFGALIKNETGQTLQGVQISFISKLWRSSTVTNALTFGYGLVDGATFTTANFLTAAGATSLVSANVAYPAAASNVAVDGNLPANQIAFNNVTIPQEIAPGETLFIRWQDFDGTGSDAGIAIDNVSLTALAGAPPATAPFVSGLTIPLDQINQTFADGVSADVTSDGGSAITSRGFVYAPTSVNDNPIIGGTGVVNYVDPLAEVGQMVATLSALTAGTSYSVKAYAINAQGTTYTTVQTFTTLAPPASFTGNYEYPFDNFTGVSGLPGEWTALSSTGVQGYVGLWDSASSNGGFYGGVSAPGVLGYTHTASTGTLTVMLRLVNDTGSTLTELNVSYLGRVEKVAEARTPEWAVTVAGVAAPDLTYSTSAGVDETKTATITGLSIPPGDGFSIVWSCDRGAGTGSSRRIGVADVVVSTGAISTPTVNVTGSAFNAFSTTVGTPSAAQTVSVSGANLTSDLTVTAPDGFEVSSDELTYASSVDLTPTSGTVSATISVRLSGAAAGSFSGDVSFASTGATTQTRAVSGTVTSAYDAWAASYSLTGANALPAADPDGDGFDNSSEYAFGTNPSLANAALTSATTSGGSMTVTWIERNSGFTYAAQSTANLATTPFSTDGSVSPTTSGDQAGVPSGYTRKQFTVTATGNKFFRVRATSN